jgi:hypothetical protein
MPCRCMRPTAMRCRVRRAAMRCRRVGRATMRYRGVGRAAMRYCRMGATCRGITTRLATAVSAGYCSTTSAIACIGTAAAVFSAAAVTTTAAAVSSSPATAEAMLAPAVPVSPIRPRADTQENAVEEIAWSIKTAGRAAVRRIVVVAIGTAGRSYADYDLCTGRWHKGQGRKERCCTSEKQTALCQLMSPRTHSLKLQHCINLRNRLLLRNAVSPVSGARRWITDQYRPLIRSCSPFGVGQGSGKREVKVGAKRGSLLRSVAPALKIMGLRGFQGIGLRPARLLSTNTPSAAIIP